MQNAIQDIIAERHRQISVEGWTPEHDDKHTDRSLLRAAIAYAISAATEAYSTANPISGWWKWSSDWWKPTDRRRDLVKAAALIIAEIERMDRASGNISTVDDRLAIGAPVVKITGYPFPGELRALFTTRLGELRAVVEATGIQYAGMLHIFNTGQIAALSAACKTEGAADAD